MKRSLALGLLFVSALCIADEYPPRSVPLGVASTVVLPAMKPDTIVPYTVGYTNTQGTYVSVPGSSLTFWLVSPSTGGTNNGVLVTNALANVDIVDGDVTWRSIPATRTWFSISNVSTGTVFYSEGQGSAKAAVMNKGIAVAVGATFESRRGAEIGSKCYQGQVNMIATTAEDLVTVFEE